MALFLRGNVWWMEYRTSKIRRVKSTGLRKEDKKKAEAVWAAWRLAFGARPQRNVVKELLDAVYLDRPESARGSLPLASVWQVYEDWRAGKSKVLGRLTLQKRRGAVERFVAWASGEGVPEIGLVSVAVARRYVASLVAAKANKTVRNEVSDLLTVWDAVAQMDPSVHNPWRAALPDNDGSSVVLRAFAPADEQRVLAVAKAFGHGWHLASVIARWTGLRYGDVANLEWGDAEEALRVPKLDHGVVDLARRVIVVDPSKTRRHGVRVELPMAGPLYAELSRIDPDRRDGLLLAEHALAYPKGLKNELSFARVIEQAGLSSRLYTFHSWRHTFRTRLAEAGVSEEVARRLGGWTNSKMAAHYDHASHLAEMQAAISAMAGHA